MRLPRSRIIGNIFRKGVLAAFLIASALALVDDLHEVPQLVPIAHAAESGHSTHEEGGSCGGCGGVGGGEQGGGSHVAGSSHGARRGGEKGHGGGTQRGFGGAGRDIGDTIFRGGHSPGNGNSSQRVEPATRPTSGAGQGVAGGAAGGPVTSVKGKGNTYGNLWVVLRDPLNGAPILDANGHVQPILANGAVVQLTAGGDLPAAYVDQIQTVEFSRLNMSRSPSRVLDRALRDALSTIASADEVTHDDAGRLVAIKGGIANAIESPMQNLALYVDAIKRRAFTAQQAASFLAAASDKSQPITLDIVVYLNTILGLNGPDGTNYVNYAHFSYDRAETYVGNVTYTVSEGEGRYRTKVAPILEAVFHGENVDKTGADAFAQAADDARQIIKFLHDYGTSD